jgi:hypothetical protein
VKGFAVESVDAILVYQYEVWQQITEIGVAAMSVVVPLVHRSRDRIRQTGEIFTPQWLVDEMLGELGKQDPTLFTDPTKTFLEPACGDGNFVVRILHWKVVKFREANPGAYVPMARILGSIYAIDLMADNIAACRLRVLREVAAHMGISVGAAREKYRSIINRNIVVGNALHWDYDNWCAKPAEPVATTKKSRKVAA